MATDYFTKWIEAIPPRNTTDAVIIKFMEENMLSLFGCLIKIIIDNTQVFKYAKFTSFYQKFNIIIEHSTTYYTQGNGSVESSNEIVVRVLKKNISENDRKWDSQWNFPLWANQVNPKRHGEISF